MGCDLIASGVRAAGRSAGPLTRRAYRRDVTRPMSSYILFLILGLGSGATYAILGQGLVLKYRSAGVVDFAHGAVAMFIAYVFVNLRSFGELELPVVMIPHQISLNGGAGINTTLAIVISLVYAAIFGLVLYVLVYRPLRRRLAADPGLRVGRRHARPAGDRGPELQHRAGRHQPDLPQLPADDLRGHVPRGPPVLHRRGRPDLGRALRSSTATRASAWRPGLGPRTTAAPR